MYQLAPDEKRRDYGLNVLDTYFNNGVRRTYTYLLTELADTQEIMFIVVKDKICSHLQKSILSLPLMDYWLIIILWFYYVIMVFMFLND